MSKAYNKTIIASLVILALSVFGGAVAASHSVDAMNLSAESNAPVTSKEWAIVSAVGGYQVVELLDYSINHH